jgi:hypothetical protein|tara:strand:+ start:3829 stop:4188 length:360 start_codon:yes stop_codon:yes gene_type:complete
MKTQKDDADPIGYMADTRIRAYNIERRYRTLKKPWSEIIRELRAERGALLGSNEYTEMVGVERANSLDVIDTRLKDAEAWIAHYEAERVDSNRKLGLFRSRKLLAEISNLSDEELEGRV